jgi:endonuclease/exonuclease/phosphatase family metal-dependent hydrolase
MTTFKLLTLNCFGVPTTQTRRRLLTLADELNRAEYNVVCLQEVQSHIYRKLLLGACTAYPSSAYQPFVHAPKGGLLTLSRHPIREGSFTQFKERGSLASTAAADWILHKGILYTRLNVNGTLVTILNTHLNANYRGDWDKYNHYTRFEKAQLDQIATYVNAQPHNSLVIVAGDFNIPRKSWLYEEFISATGVIDPLADDVRPTFRVPLGLPNRYAHPIDFAFVRLPKTDPNVRNVKVSADLCFEDKVPLVGGGRAFLSDHYAVELRLNWEKQAVEAAV